MAISDGVSWRKVLTRLGFSLNVAPQIIKIIISAVLSQEKMVKKVMWAYLDDIYINEDVSPTSHIQAKLVQFGLIWKDPEWREDVVHILDWMSGGRKVPCNGNGKMWFQTFLKFSQSRLFFSLCRKLVGYLPVWGWLHAAVGIIKCRAIVVTSRWDDQTSDALLT